MNDGGELITTTTATGGILSMPVEQMQSALAEYRDRRAAFRDWLKAQMVEGVHFGIPPGCEPKTQVIDGRTHYGVWMKGGMKFFPPEQWQPKPSLYKAGAQLLCDLLRLRPEFDLVPSPQGMSETVVVKCRLFSSDRLIAEGHGARKVGSKGGDENNCIKMAEKCALVDAVLNYTGLSDLFTQDLEERQPNQPPAANENAPKADPRGGRVDASEVTALVERWTAVFGGDESRESLKPKFARWVFATAAVPEASALKLSAWTREAMKTCNARLDMDEAEIFGGGK